MIEKMNVSLENLIEEEDKKDIHFGEIDFDEIQSIDMDMYLQAAGLRKKAVKGKDIASIMKQIELLGNAVERLSRGLNKKEKSRKNFLGMVANKLGSISSKLQAKEKGVEPHEPRGMDFLEEEDKKNHHIVLILEKDKDALTKLSDEDRKLYRKTADLREEVVEGNYADEDVVKEINAAIKELDALRIKEKDSLFLELIANQLTIVQLTANSILEDEK